MNIDGNIMKYDKHPSADLVKLFMEKPFQGQDPTRAKVIIIGNDANYSPQISTHPFFQKILKYHFDGIRFWKEHHKHHPFLLADYPFDRRKGGVRYHLNFSKMLFTSDDAEHFSFVELLNVPTVGNTGNNKKLFFDMLNKDHLNWLESVILSGKKKFAIVNQTLAATISRIYKEFGVLRSLCHLLEGKKAQSVVLENDNVILYNGYSLSHSVSDAYLDNLRIRISEFIERN